ncbi:hypothetical protein QVD17_33103 [Tagetes erecta]|uniref:non-specific serine/threonine protein kinase n=1 Tax=Tagetes erecta TaxID=13708 RepID=A0AAD8NL48_TARER|nr:hypothetical protein QVD17_33103 [Tagetes erecta]
MNNSITGCSLLEHLTRRSLKKLLLIFAYTLILYSNFTFTQSTQEVKVMKEIWVKLGLLGKKEWDFDKGPCSDEGNWKDSIICDCSFESNTTCHVTHIVITPQNVSTNLPSEFSKLPHLQLLDLSLNYFTGSIPSEWATILNLRSLSLYGNRLSGPFPTTLTRITTLLSLTIRNNHFSGPIPEEISNLSNLDSLNNEDTCLWPSAVLLIATGYLDNKRPLSAWHKLSTHDLHQKEDCAKPCKGYLIERYLQGCSVEGPLPSSISVLTLLEDLRISDLKGEASTFPSLQKVYGLRILILRNCLIHGKIPNYFGNMMYLKTIDLSFNNLTGDIPSSFSELVFERIYLTKNNLTGRVPGWVFSSNKVVNVVESYSLSTDKQNDINPCQRKDFPCTKSDAEKIYSLHINCGGKEINVNSTIKYEADIEKKGASPYYNAGYWAFSSTGNFFDIGPDNHIISNTSNLHNISTLDAELYKTARRTAISLTYYGLCLLNGNYTVKLHFAEIVFTQYNAFDILGKRVFDVYVQGELKLKDFDIVIEAGGTGRAVVKSYAVIVKNNTLKIQLYWAGRGSIDIPIFTGYGPLISAISVVPNFKPPKFGKKIEAGIIAAVVGGLLFVLLILVILWRKGYIMGEKIVDRELRGIDLQTGIFTLRQIEAATKNFDPSNKLGEGGFGAVYKGLLSDGTIMAVKQLSSKSKQGATEFINEIGMLSGLRHPNLVRLYGCCVEGSQMCLIYEYMENNCLSRVLFGTDKVSKARLTWPVRMKICIGVAQGIVYLHEGSNVTIIHRDIKASNVLLDGNFNAKISDFGLAKLNDDDGNTHISTRVVGTMGYMAPEYAMRGILTPKADVYSFGIVTLEIVTGKGNNHKPNPESFYLIDWVAGKLLMVVDPDLGSEYPPEETLTILNVAILCTAASPVLRPTMSQTIDMLTGQTNISNFRKHPSFASKGLENIDIRHHFWQEHSEIRPARDESDFESIVTELS